MPASASPDIIVVGAGVVGCAVAYELASRGASVTMVDQRRPGLGATQASAGMLAPYAEAADEGPLFEMGARSLALYDGFVARVRASSGLDVPYVRTGSLHVATSRESLDRFERTRGILERHGVDARVLSAADARAEEPQLGTANVGGLLVPVHGHVSQVELTLALTRSAERAGARLLSGVHVTRVSGRGEAGVRVDTSAGTLDATRVVLAAGAWSSRIHVDAEDARVPVEPVRGQLLYLGWSGDAPRRIIWNERCYMVPRTDGTVLVGATVEHAGFDERTTVAGVRDLLDSACDLLPQASHASLLGAKVGLRPGTPDELPIIGWSDAVRGLMYATGHYRNGVLLAPLTASMVAGAILDGAADPALAWTRPGRFGAI
ncbi:MAG: glycine oxidase ThiO [Vicinamibacterales bacterium]